MRLQTASLAEVTPGFWRQPRHLAWCGTDTDVPSTLPAAAGAFEKQRLQGCAHRGPPAAPRFRVTPPGSGRPCHVSPEPKALPTSWGGQKATSRISCVAASGRSRQPRPSSPRGSVRARKFLPHYVPQLCSAPHHHSGTQARGGPPSAAPHLEDVTFRVTKIGEETSAQKGQMTLHLLPVGQQT